MTCEMIIYKLLFWEREAVKLTVIKIN